MSGPSRAELLEQCKARGLRATGWKRDRMLEELGRLERADQWAREKAERRAGQRQDEPEPAEEQKAPAEWRPRLSGWCSLSPMWSEQHPQCKRGDHGCPCECHKPGWVRPDPPDGAWLSKFSKRQANDASGDRPAAGTDEETTDEGEQQ